MKASPDAAAALDKLEQALNAVEKAGGAPVRQQAPPDSTTDPKQQQWKVQHARIEPLYLEFLRGTPADGAKIRAVMAYAIEQAEAGAFDKGLAALARLEPLLKASGTATSSTTEAAPASTKKPQSDTTAQAPSAEFARLWKSARTAGEMRWIQLTINSKNYASHCSATTIQNLRISKTN